MATKRKFEDDDNDHDSGIPVMDTNWRDKPIKTTITKHSLDSDEEDDDNDGKAYNILDEDAIEGQEEGLAGVEGGIQITPFNMKEEMEEGHFDTDGMYHWKKDGKVVRDNWLENIDWVKVHNKKQSNAVDRDEDSSELPSGAPSQFDDISVYKEIVPFMKPKETIAKTLRRLAGNQNKPISSTERWKRKKAGIDTSKEEEEAKANVSKLTELANKILQNTGNMDVYQESYEYISEKIELATRKNPVAKSAELDMYSDDFDTKEKERLETKDTVPTPTQSDTAAKPPEDSGGVTWEFKEEKDSTEISGPHSSEQMLKWTEEGRFKKEVWVRKCGQTGDFYTSKRIDFDLYI